MVGISMPGPEQVPLGPRRTLLEELHRLYRQAGTPSTRALRDAVKGNGALEATTSHDTVAAMLRGERITGPTLRSLVWVLAEQAKVDPVATRNRFNQLWERVAHDIAALPPDQLLRHLTKLSDAELYDTLNDLPEELRKDMLAALPPEKCAIYQVVAEQTEQTLRAIAEALVAMSPEQAAEMLKRQDPGKITSILYFMSEEQRNRILAAMGLEETAKFVCREVISMADGYSDQAERLVNSSDLYVFGLGLCYLDPPEADRLREILGPVRTAKALAVAVAHARDREVPDAEPDPASIAGSGAENAVPQADAIWDRLEEFLVGNLGTFDGARDLEIWLGPEGRSGHRLSTPFGQLDFLCVNRASGALVVVKLRRDLPVEALFAQVVGGMGYAAMHLAGPGQRVEGIVVTDAADDKLSYLAAGFPGVEVMTYSLEFRLTAIKPGADG